MPLSSVKNNRGSFSQTCSLAVKAWEGVIIDLFGALSLFRELLSPWSGRRPMRFLVFEGIWAHSCRRELINSLVLVLVAQFAWQTYLRFRNHWNNITLPTIFSLGAGSFQGFKNHFDFREAHDDRGRRSNGSDAIWNKKGQRGVCSKSEMGKSHPLRQSGLLLVEVQMHQSREEVLCNRHPIVYIVQPPRPSSQSQRYTIYLFSKLAI